MKYTLRQSEFIDKRGNFIVKLYKHGNYSEEQKVYEIENHKVQYFQSSLNNIIITGSLINRASIFSACKKIIGSVVF